MRSLHWLTYDYIVQQGLLQKNQEGLWTDDYRAKWILEVLGLIKEYSIDDDINCSHSD